MNNKYSFLENWEKTAVSKIEYQINIVGTSFIKDKTVFNDIQIDTKLMLVREKNNPYDNNAILVTLMDGRPLGHFPGEWATVFASKLDVGVEYNVRIIEIKPKTIKVSVKRKNYDEEILYDIFKKHI